VLILALDTTSRPGSIALARDATVLEEWTGPSEVSHAQRLPRDILDLLGRHDVSLASIDLYAVAAGPGSFTGLRIGIATMQGLAFAHRRKMVGVSALEALAVASRHTALVSLASSCVLGAWMDAQRGEVFAALYGAAAEPTLTALEGPAVGEPETVLGEWGARVSERADVFFVGDGAVRYRNVITRAVASAHIVTAVPPLAGPIAELARQAHLRGEAVGPDAIRPLYVRRPDAELARAKRS
jgi:tRNA threonylcarbamoyladenosine biosynthesis protein TsaB